ncbi:MAG: enoyl-CoA hydratase/isomerase family protein [Deltaproteobacteria bacterium]|nr:enoyl-CoA hydratase/isomerase family protein [Deltaproteobacteria bacterium]
MAYEYITYKKEGRIAYVTINRPESMNSLHPPAHEELWDVWCDFRDDSEVWVAIFTGAGEKAFSAGNDLKFTAELMAKGPFTPQLLPPGGFGGITNHFKCWKPIIAAVNGYALGGGFEMVLASDIVIAAEHARFGLPEPKVGLVAIAGGVQRLSRQIPLKTAMGMILTGRHITAQEAYRLGLVNEVVPKEELMVAARRWADEILECSPMAVRSSKEQVLTGLELPLEAAINNQYYTFQQMMSSQDIMEGPKAFAEKRKPIWKGK